MVTMIALLRNAKLYRVLHQNSLHFSFCFQNKNTADNINPGSARTMRVRNFLSWQEEQTAFLKHDGADHCISLRECYVAFLHTLRRWLARCFQSKKREDGVFLKYSVLGTGCCSDREVNEIKRCEKWSRFGGKVSGAEDEDGWNASAASHGQAAFILLSGAVDRVKARAREDEKKSETREQTQNIHSSQTVILKCTHANARTDTHTHTTQT